MSSPYGGSSLPVNQSIGRVWGDIAQMYKELLYGLGNWVCLLVQVEQGRSAKHVEALHLRIREHRQELALAKKDAKRAAWALKQAGVRQHGVMSCN